LSKLSNLQHKLKCDIEASTSSDKREELRKERRKVKREIDGIVKNLEERELDEKLKYIEGMKNDSNKTHHAVRELRNLKPKKPLYVEDENNQIAGSVEAQIKVIHEHFKNVLGPEVDENNNEINYENHKYKPKKMEKPFTTDEIEKAVKSMKNGKSAGIDELHSELLKYAPSCVKQEIADILNTVAETGEYPKELRTGILTPLQKPGKKKGPPANLRPIILLSVLRKILAICMIRRCWDKLSQEIPRDQAAYQAGRSTTEHVFAVKVLAEKAITSSNYEIYLLLLDMSKAFDTVKREDLLKDLQEILSEDELHLMHILINDVEIFIRVGQEMSEESIKTTIGICQGDCLSAVLFIYYLAKSLSKPKDVIHNDHNYSKPEEEYVLPRSLQDHEYTNYKPDFFKIAPKYADDITWVSTSNEYVEEIKSKIPKKLKNRNLNINEGKTEEFKIGRLESNEWKDCKLLGSKIDTQKDIERRKGIAIGTMNEMKHIFKSRRTKMKTKIRTFEGYISSVFLYNCELWTMNKTIEDAIDAFHRRLLRYAINIYWPRKISNEKLYKKTNVKPWSVIIMKRRMSWLGHLMRLPKEVPARKALQEALRPSKRPRGKPQSTWLSTIKKDLEEGKIMSKAEMKNPEVFLRKLEEITEDRSQWGEASRSAISRRKKFF